LGEMEFGLQTKKGGWTRCAECESGKLELVG